MQSKRCPRESLFLSFFLSPSPSSFSLLRVFNHSVMAATILIRTFSRMLMCAHLRSPIPCHNVINRADPKESLGCKPRGNLVIAILPGGLAFKSNLQLDHYILSVNGVPTTGMVAADIVELIDKQGLHMVLQTMPMVSIDQSLLQLCV